MNRRQFFTGIIMALASTTASMAQANVEVTTLKSLWNWGKKKEFALKVGDIHLVQGNTIIKLPSEPRDGDEVLLEIPNTALRFPATVRSDSTAILGENEDLILDSFGNIRLTYQSQTKNWILT